MSSIQRIRRAGVRALPAVLLLAISTTHPVAPALAGDPMLRRTVTVSVVEAAGPAVVNILTEQVAQRSSPFQSGRRQDVFERFFRDFFEPRMPRQGQSLGSGVVIDSDGHILTNEHVVRRASRIRVSLADGREFEASLVGADPNNDIAVLQVSTEDELPWIEPGSSDDLMVGEPVIAIGNPFGLQSTVTTGVISAVDRSMRTEQRVFHGFLQTDASINPGNSGGPLLNAEGELIGINTAIYQGAEGIGFAIPIDVARRVVADLIDDGEVTPVWLGLDFQDLDAGLSDALAIPAGVSGALVNRVREESPAGVAGVHRGDVVTHVDRRPISSARAFFEILETSSVSQTLEITLWRDGAKRQVSVEVAEIPDSHVRALVQELLGVDLRRHETGAYLVDAVRRGSGAARVGVRNGDRVLGINGRSLSDDDTLRRAILELRGRDRALVVVQRGNDTYHVTIPLV
jgi:serine protease Do